MVLQDTMPGRKNAPVLKNEGRLGYFHLRYNENKGFSNNIFINILNDYIDNLSGIIIFARYHD